MIIKIYPQNPNEKSVAQAADILARDGVIIYPTDSVYAFGCSLKSTKAIERIRAITGKTGPDFSIICPDLSVVAAYAKVDNTVFKLLKRNLPGPFTFILNASGKIPDKFLEKKKTVGIRIPDNGIPIALVEALGNPMVTASVKDSREEEYTTDPSLIYERYGTLVDAVIDGGYGNHVPTTVVDCTDPDDISILREGIGNLVYVRNKCLDYLKHKVFEQKYVENVKASFEIELNLKLQSLDRFDVYDISERNQMEKLIRDAINSLPKRCRDIFLLSRMEGLKYREISERLGISVNTVECQMGIALKKLRAKLNVTLAA